MPSAPFYYPFASVSLPAPLDSILRCAFAVILLASSIPSALALTQEAAIEKCRMTVGQPMVRACMQVSGGGKKLELYNSDIHDWRITCADTGVNSNIGQRLKAVEKYVGDDEEFLANYSDGLTDLPLPRQLEHFHQQAKIASFLCVRPNLSYHMVSVEEGTGGLVSGIDAIDSGSVRINGGFFVFKRKIFDYIREKEELVGAPFQRLITEKQLIGYRYDGFWESMDTFKDKQHLESLYAGGTAPWEVWKNNGHGLQNAAAGTK